MFENLSEKLQRVFKNLRGEGKLTAENMESALREIRVALLEADVHFRVVKQLIENVKEKAMGQEVLQALSPAQQVIGIVKDELVKVRLPVIRQPSYKRAWAGQCQCELFIQGVAHIQLTRVLSRHPVNRGGQREIGPRSSRVGLRISHQLITE